MIPVSTRVSTRASTRLRSALISGLVLVALVTAPAGPVAAAGWSGRYSIWRASAYATQYLDASCVGATIQITLNIARGTTDHSKRHQLQFLAYAAQNSKYPVTDGGADPEGWARALVHYSAGNDWGWTTSGSMQSALRTAATQIRATGIPIGLLVHFGRHAWLMTGFEATADPAVTSNFTVTAAEVLGPLWPSGTLNGQHFDPGPGTWMSTGQLARKFNIYLEPGQPIWYGKFVTVVPQVSKANQGSGAPGSETPDLQSTFGWIYAFQQLAKSTPVRDFLWLP